jgi:EmrB/QacA subfamily drug resistance transporter
MSGHVQFNMTDSHSGKKTKSAPRSATLAHPHWIVATTILASSLAFIDGSVVNVGLPAIGAALNGSAADLQWIVNIYLLPLSALLLFGGAAGDRFGRARLLILGTTLFAIASVGCALAPNLPWLLAGRAIQGIGAALLMPNSLAILGASFSGEARGRAVGIWASASAVMGAAGPVIGGWLIDTVGWRAIFLLNLPPAIGAIVLAVIFVRDERRRRKAPALDVLGGVWATLCLGALAWGLTLISGSGGWTTTAVGLLAVSVVTMYFFLRTEKRLGANAMMPLALFGSSSFIGLTALTVLLYGALGALMVTLPYTLIKAGSYSATQAGSALLPFAVVLALASPLMGRVAARVGPRWPLGLGSLVVAAGFILLLRTGVHTDYWPNVFPAMLVIAIGMAGAVAPLTTAVLSSVDNRHSGSASGLNSAVSRSAGMMATALVGGVLGASGAALVSQFHVTCVACACASIAAAACAFLLVRVEVPKK